MIGMRHDNPEPPNVVPSVRHNGGTRGFAHGTSAVSDDLSNRSLAKCTASSRWNSDRPRPTIRPIRAEASSMSPNLRSSDRLNPDRLFENVLVSRLESALGHDIHMSTKDSFEFVAQVENIEQRTPRCESHQEVDVARVGVITPGRRSEHGESQAPMTFDGRLNLGARTPVAEDSREP
mgnify:CR=1 FL=1